MKIDGGKRTVRPVLAGIEFFFGLLIASGKLELEARVTTFRNSNEPKLCVGQVGIIFSTYILKTS